MKQVLFATLGVSLIALTGCATTQTNSNTAVTTNTNSVVSNANVVNTNSSNSNTNGATTNDDLSTYENEEYGFSFQYDDTMELNTTRVATSNFQTTHTEAIAQLSLNTTAPNPIMSVNVSSNSLDTTVDEIMIEDIAATKTKTSSTLSGKTVTEIAIRGGSINTTLYVYELNGETIIISVPELSSFETVKNSIQFSK